MAMARSVLVISRQAAVKMMRFDLYGKVRFRTGIPYKGKTEQPRQYMRRPAFW